MAFVDTRTLEPGSRIEADVCVIGSGAAGLALASHFFDRSRRVVLLESGGMALEPGIQSLYAGRVVGQSHAPLDSCRLRFFGGTTNHWTAHVRRLEPIDFAERSWVPRSGWPLGLEELTPYYAQAASLLRVPDGSFELPSARRHELSVGSDRVSALLRYVVPEEDRRLGPILRDRMQRSRNVDTYLYANVLAIEVDESRKRVRELRVGTLEGVRVSARARFYVLAAGGIENPRILLLSSIGSGGDTVGAFYANHPGGWGGYLQPLPGRLPAPIFRAEKGPRGAARPFLRLSDETQRRQQLLNCWMEVVPRVGPAQVRKRLAADSIGPDPASELDEVGLRDRDVANLALDMERLGEPGGQAVAKPRPFAVRLIAEPTPNPQSRVRLDDSVDAFGQRRALLDWRLEARDSESARTSLEVLGREIAAAGVGRLRILFPRSGFESLRTVGSHHHMGSTRMSRDPSQGVVDADCRVHGIPNLFVAGSSVFPTYGTANPTYTIIALAFRLADHLQKELAA